MNRRRTIDAAAFALITATPLSYLYFLAYGVNHIAFWIAPLIAGITAGAATLFLRRMNAWIGLGISLVSYFSVMAFFAASLPGASGFLGSFVGQAAIGLILFGTLFLSVGAVGGHFLGKKHDS